MRELRLREAPQPAQVLVGHSGTDQAPTQVTWLQSPCLTATLCYTATLYWALLVCVFIRKFIGMRIASTYSVLGPRCCLYKDYVLLLQVKAKTSVS